MPKQRRSKSAKIDDYPITVRPLSPDEGGGYLCEYPDVPGCMGDGETSEEAINDAKAALKATLETVRELGLDAPRPATASGQWRMRAPKSLHQRLAARAKAEGVSLNTLAVALLAEGLGQRQVENAQDMSGRQRKGS